MKSPLNCEYSLTIFSQYLVNDIISKGIQDPDQLEDLFNTSLRRFGFEEDAYARQIVQKLRDDLHLFQYPSLALATINSYHYPSLALATSNSYQTIESQVLNDGAATVLSSHSSNVKEAADSPKAEPRRPLRAQTASKPTLRAASGEKLVRASSASRAAHVLAQRFNLE